MSSSTQNDLQAVGKKSNHTPASVAIIEPSPETRINIEYTASLVSKCGLWIESRIMANFGNNMVKTMFFFLRRSDPFHAFYQHKVAEFRNAQKQDIQHDSPAIKLGFTFKDLPLEPRTCQLFRLKELDIIKLTAQFVVRYGMHFWRDLMNRVMKDPLFAFMEPADSSFGLFSILIDAYTRVLKPYHRLLKRPGAILESFFNLLREKMQEEGVEMHAFVGGLDYFAGREDQELSPPGHHLSTQMQPPMRHARAIDPFRDPLPEPLSFPLAYPEGITPMELGVFKLTAQFVARYGVYFERDLIKRVIDDPRFEFLKSTSDRCDLFHLLVGAYAIVSVPCRKLRKPDACTETVLEGFLNLLRGGKQEEGVEMAMTGEEDQFPQPLPEERYQKRQKGSSTIRVSVPNVDDGQVIEIAVQSLLGNVASLKEKRAGEIQIPANKHKLSGQAGFLKDKMPLAHYNVGAGETLTLSL